ncbi:MAG: hypothetical protein VX910_01620 [Candidatus Latescibacterota bacterium]|nr:hypothetical protein [Candidatus Latescibacterota bacterium]
MNIKLQRGSDEASWGKVLQGVEILKTLARNHSRVLNNESILDRVKKRIQKY